MGGQFIRVDTDNLRTFANTYHSRANVLNESGKTIQFVISLILDKMPDYDGRLQQSAHYDTEDLFNRCQAFSRWFTEDGESLINIAKSFEEVDGQTVKIFSDCSDMTSNACLIDLGMDPNLATEPQTITNPDGSVTTTSVEIIRYPDGSASQIIIERTTYPDGSVHEKKTITTVWQLSEETAQAWNEGDKAMVGALLFLSGLGVDKVVEGIELVTLSLDVAHEILPADGIYADGDTITNTLIVETDYAPDGTPLQEEVTNKTIIVDNNGVTKFSDTTGIDPTGALKP